MWPLITFEPLDVRKKRLLIEHGADRNHARIDNGTTPLHIAVEKGHAEVVRLLVEAGVDVDQADSNTGVTPLLMAAETGQVEVVRMLIQAGADTEKGTTEVGATPLYMACQNQHSEVVDLLLGAGADRMSIVAVMASLNMRRKQGRTQRWCKISRKRFWFF